MARDKKSMENKKAALVFMIIAIVAITGCLILMFQQYYHEKDQICLPRARQLALATDGSYVGVILDPQIPTDARIIRDLQIYYAQSTKEVK